MKKEEWTVTESTTPYLGVLQGEPRFQNWIGQYNTARTHAQGSWTGYPDGGGNWNAKVEAN